MTVTMILNFILFLCACAAFGIFAFGVATVSALSFGALLARIPPSEQDPNNK